MKVNFKPAELELVPGPQRALAGELLAQGVEAGTWPYGVCLVLHLPWGTPHAKRLCLLGFTPDVDVSGGPYHGEQDWCWRRDYPAERPRLFELHRTADVSGVSGTGHVADGVLFPDGNCVVRWRSAHRSTIVYDSIADVIAIHGHNGMTSVRFLTDGIVRGIERDIAAARQAQASDGGAL